MNNRIRVGWLMFAAMVFAVLTAVLQIGEPMIATPAMAIRALFLLIALVGLFAYALGVRLLTCLFWRCYAALFGIFMAFRLPKFFAHHGDGSGKYVAASIVVSGTVGLILLALVRYAKALDPEQSLD